MVATFIGSISTLGRIPRSSGCMAVRSRIRVYADIHRTSTNVHACTRHCTLEAVLAVNFKYAQTDKHKGLSCDAY